MRLAFGVALALGAWAPALLGQELRSLFPRGAEPGRDVEVRCSGRGLSDLESVLLFEDGIEVVDVSAGGDDRATIVLRIRDDCALGAHMLMLVTKRGMTRAKTFHVGPLRSVPCEENNATPEAAQTVELDTTIDGRIRAEETDWFAFEATGGEVVRVEVEGIRLADQDFDPELEVLAPDGSALVRADDSALGRLDPIVAFRCEVAGTYRIGLHDLTFGGSASTSYRLHVGTFPRPTGVVPAGGRPGEALAVQLVGDARPGTAQLVLPERPGLHELFFKVDGRSVPTPVIVAVGAHASFTEGAVPDEPPPAPCAFHGVIAEDGEEDRFAFRAKKGERIQMRVLARHLRSALDPVLIVRDSKGAGIASDDDGFGLDARERFTAPADGTFLVCVRDHRRRGGADSFYRIEVGEPPAVATTQEAVPGRRPEDLGVAVPRGGRMATLIQVDGLDAREGIDLGWRGLPAGVTQRGGRLMSGVSTVPVVLQAATDAALGAGTATPYATAEAAPNEREVRHRHPVPLLRVRNDQVYIERTAHALPVAVTAPCPFAAEVEPPAVPLMQSGSLGLPVRITRASDHRATIVVRALWTPPGVSAGTVTLRAGQDSGTIAVSARSNAAIGRWPMVLVATADDGGVSRQVCTELFELAVEAPWITAKLSRAAVEQGAKSAMHVELTRAREFEGEVTAELGRVPRGVEAAIPAIRPDTSEIEIGLTASDDARVGRHRSIYLRLRVKTPAGEILHDVGGGEIRVDRPLPALSGSEEGR